MLGKPSNRPVYLLRLIIAVSLILLWLRQFLSSIKITRVPVTLERSNQLPTQNEDNRRKAIEIMEHNEIDAIMNTTGQNEFGNITLTAQRDQSDSMMEVTERSEKGYFSNLSKVAINMGVGTWWLPIFSPQKDIMDGTRKPVIDILSIGSIVRPEFQIAQLESWASHVYVRNFFHATEETVDMDIISPFKRDGTDKMPCLETLSSSQRVRKHVTKCRIHNIEHKTKHGDNFMDRDMKYVFYEKDWIFKKANPAGWACAQRRVGYGIGRLGKLYRERSKRLSLLTGSILPDYLFLVDDDTYYNIDAVIDNLRHEYATTLHNNSSLLYNEMMFEEAQVHAGCLVLNPSPSNFSSPHGGMGSIFNRGALHKLMVKKINDCSDEGTLQKESNPSNPQIEDWEGQVCRQLNENFIDEQPLYRPGMTISDLIIAYSSRPMHCLHSDWIVGYFVNYFILSKQWSQTLSERRLFPYKGSIEGTKGAQCRNNNENCISTSDMCHYVDPTIMKKRTKELYHLNPSQFRTTSDRLQINETTTKHCWHSCK
mmetsp:Transcript_22940/g.34797  ORF Transcript_22940/g.34797 Transcript_22940/m.34797 type:complete len:539 (+) Transcript_22940:161-1777(+)